MHYLSSLTMASRSQYRIPISLRTSLRINATLDIKLMEAMTKCKCYNVRPVEIGPTIRTEGVQCFHVVVRSNLPTSLKLFNFLVIMQGYYPYACNLNRRAALPSKGTAQ